MWIIEKIIYQGYRRYGNLIYDGMKDQDPDGVTLGSGHPIGLKSIIPDNMPQEKEKQRVHDISLLG